MASAVIAGEAERAELKAAVAFDALLRLINDNANARLLLVAKERVESAAGSLPARVRAAWLEKVAHVLAECDMNANHDFRAKLAECDDDEDGREDVPAVWGWTEADRAELNRRRSKAVAC